MRILGIDYGSKRVGVAVSDEAGQFALPLVVLKNGGKNSGKSGGKNAAGAGLLDEVIGLAENGVTEIVIGESRDYKGAPNEIFAAAGEFKAQLEKAGFMVHLQLEFMTSIQAERFQGKNDKTDASAAALILQSFLDTVQSRA